MSYTNQTQHYGLPQYVGTDVPAYLTDYNQAMATIDHGMNVAKTQADAAATTAGQAANDISALNSTVKTQATQISAAAQAASAAQTTANTADGKADDLDTRVTALEQGGGSGVKSVASSLLTIEMTAASPQTNIGTLSQITAGAVSDASKVVGISSAVNGFIDFYLGSLTGDSAVYAYMSNLQPQAVNSQGRITIHYVD